ncbi:MAG: hypothetical protein BWK79_00370 [Beggiatoa sp. IS2]|nr:MAG: hypothetical protein BWK79_00370 [Beggiatoa sp. IS2]
MSKKKKSVVNLPTHILEQQATQQLADSSYKEAIESYKQLLRQEDREEWRSALATAYLERAKSFAYKRMYKEATVFWENRATLCNDQTALDLYILWLIRAGRHIRAARLYNESVAQLAESEIHRQLLTWFALLMLTNHEEIKELFSTDTLLFRHYQIIFSALQAYCQGDDTSADVFLKQLSFHSPYRDFRFILKALILFERDQQGANRVLAQIPSDSPFSYFNQLIQTIINPNEKLWDVLAQSGPHEQALLACLKGWDKAQLKTILALRLAVKRANSKTTFGTILAHRHLLGESYSQKFCLALLPDHIVGIKDYQKAFGDLPLFEQERIAALSEERKQRFEMVEKHWRKCISILERNLQEGDNALKIALIFRHLVEGAKRYTEESNERNSRLMLQDLEHSLTFDPSDKATYIELITTYKEMEDDKNYQKWVEAAVLQFPKDSEILMMAIGAARYKKAFKKATKLANALLQVDPINVRARQILLSSHLAHAYKLIKSGKYDLARKELTQAAGLERENQRSGIVSIVQGLLEWQNKQEEIAIRLLSEGIQQAGYNLKAYLHLLVEATRLDIDVEPIFKLLPFFKLSKFRPPLSKSKLKFPLPERQDVLSLITALNSYQEDGIQFLPNVLEYLKSSLEKVNCQEFSQDELTRICQCFEKMGAYSLSKHYANKALSRWADAPAFVYYRVYAEVEGNIDAISEKDFDRLEKALERSRRDGDKRSAMLIADFLMQSLKNQRLEEFFDELNDSEDESEIDEEQIKKLIEQLKKAGLELPEPPTGPQRRNRKKR